MFVGLALLASPAVRGEEEGPNVVENGNKVSIEYTLKLGDGKTADTNVGGEPLVYEQGSSQILPALEKQLLGLKVNDSKKVELTPEQGYGVRNPDAVQKVPKKLIPEGAREVGAQLVAQGQDGSQQLVRVADVGEEEVTLDLNHPLAGETLHFDVKVLSIE